MLFQLFRDHPSWMHAVFGGALIGISASLMLLLHGKVAGISGILGGALSLPSPKGDFLWRLLFLAGLIGGGALIAFWAPALLPAAMARGPLAIIAAGLLVGFGTRLGNGCTSGHGICGVGRLSFRSTVATAIFIALGLAAATSMHLLFGAAP